ncbi:MAG TPA: hypothetical protein VGE01_09040 [Fimbriimonas sp.]
MPTKSAPPEAAALVPELVAFIDRYVAANGGSTRARQPGHRVKFHWPPHPISYEFHVLASDWAGKASFEAYGETFEVVTARTPYGVFGRCEAIWHEDRGDTLEEMLENLRNSSEPLFQRQIATNRTLEKEGRFTGHVSELPPLDLLKLLYCDDRDVASEAKGVIESQASSRVFLPALLAVLGDRRHPNRRSAQWCVLDLFEDLPSFCEEEEGELKAVQAIKELIWDAEDDYARTIYKAGVVLGGHIPELRGGPTLMECLKAPSKFGRRSAIHGLFHVVEWIPEMQDRVVRILLEVAVDDPDPQLRDYAREMAQDIADWDGDHHPEPVFPEEC